MTPFACTAPVLVRMASAPRPVSKPQDEPRDVAAYLRAVAADERLREAVEVSSRTLARYLDKLDAGVELPAKRLRSLALSLTRYRLRLESRATPFGLFAGVAMAGFGPSAEVRVAGPGRKRAFLDTGWTHSRIAVVVNDLATRRDGRLVLPGEAGETSVAGNAFVDWVCERAHEPVPYAELLTAAAAHFPDHAEERLDAVLASLLDLGFLLSPTTPPHSDGELDAYERSGPGEGRAILRGVVERIDPGGELRRPPVHVDLAMDADVVLPHLVADEVAGYASAMWAISGGVHPYAHLEPYLDRFVDRYGTAGAVPLAELVDEHRGLGLPAERTAPVRPDADRRAVVAELLGDALAAGTDIALTDDDVGRLAGEPGGAPPRSLELSFQLLADSAADLDAGRFTLVASPHPGSQVAGAMAGRFAELTGAVPALSRTLLAGLDDAADGSPVVAQVRFEPRHRRAWNLMRVPTLAPYELPVGVCPDVPPDRRVDWRDLLVGATPSGFTLTWARDGREVIPVVPHMVALEREAPAVVRLLVDIALARHRPWTGWSWHGLDALPCLPRVGYRRVVVAPRRWRPDRRLREAVTDRDAWPRAVRDWQERHGVPDQVQLARLDQAYGVDLRDHTHRELLRDEVSTTRDGSAVSVVEDLSADGRGLGWSGGRSTEIVVPLARRPDAPRPRRTQRTARRQVDDVVHLPGEDWVFAKLYAAEATHDTLLAGRVAELVASFGRRVDRWFYVRYRDPEPHLRLRFHGTADGLLPELAAWARAARSAGAIGDIVLAPYRPEAYRYGGAHALDDAERLFCVDSQSAVVQLRAGLDLPVELLVAANHAMLLESLGRWDWCGWVDAAFPKTEAHDAFRRHRTHALDLVTPGRVASGLAERTGLAELVTLWTDAAEPRTYGGFVLDRPPAERDDVLRSLLHMQHNRLVGPDRESELRAVAVLRGVARTHLGRRRHLGTPT